MYIITHKKTAVFLFHGNVQNENLVIAQKTSQQKETLTVMFRSHHSKLLLKVWIQDMLRFSV